MLTTKWPASLILAELAACLVKLNAEVHVEWRPREDNTWADALSKGDFTGFDPEKRCTFDLDSPDFFSVLPLLREKPTPTQLHLHAVALQFLAAVGFRRTCT